MSANPGLVPTGNSSEAKVSRCEEICDGAPSCAPCAAYELELDRIGRGRVPGYVEGSDDAGRWAVLNGRVVRRHYDD